MNKTYLIIVLSVFIVFYSYGQEKEFERELNKFRYNLNYELEKYDDEKIYKLNFSKNDSLIVLIDHFISENKGKIKTHREHILESYEDNPDFKFDITAYEKADFSEINNNLDDFNLDANVPLSKLLWIDPITEVSTFKTIYYSRNRGAVKLAVFNTKANITSSLIKTRQLNNHQWEIIDNSYDIVGRFIYDLNKGKVTNVEIFERKTKTPR